MTTRIAHRVLPVASEVGVRFFPYACAGGLGSRVVLTEILEQMGIAGECVSGEPGLIVSFWGLVSCP